MKMQLISVNLGQNAERGSHATGIDVKLVYCFQKIYILTSLSTVVTRYFLDCKVDLKKWRRRFSDNFLPQNCSGDLKNINLNPWCSSLTLCWLTYCSADGYSSMRRLTRPTTRGLSRLWWPKSRVLVTITTRWWTWQTTSSLHRCVTMITRRDL